MVKHVEDYPTAHLDPWDMPNGGRATQEIIDRKPKQHRTGYTTQVAREHFFVDDLKHPYNENKRFDWIRGYQEWIAPILAQASVAIANSGIIGT